MGGGIFAFHKTGMLLTLQWAYARGAEQPRMYQTLKRQKLTSKMPALPPLIILIVQSLSHV